MRLFGIIFMSASFICWTRAVDVVCSKKTKKVVPIEEGDSFSFRTQSGPKYVSNSRCQVTYKAGASCPSIQFSCSEFSLNSKKANCKGGDKMTVVANGKNKNYCKTSAPNVTASKSIKVVFTSNKKTQARGAQCTAQCVSTPSTTPSPSPSSTSGDGLNTLYRQELSDYPAALCNDGTAATYFYSSDAFTNDNLLIYLEGGGGCGDKASCEQRCTSPYSAHRCTTNHENTMTLTSTFWSKDQTTNPPFHDFASIWVDYCSSDAWIGTRNATSETGGYHFHGKDIVKAVIDDIIAKKSNIAVMDQIVILGTSAGALGVQSNCDLFADKFKAENSDLDIRCIADSGDLIPAVGYDCSTEEAANEKLEFIGAELDATCTEANDEWECVAFSSLYNYIETPLMVVHNYIDKIVSGECYPQLILGNTEYWNEWKQQVLQLSQQFILDKPGNGLFVPNCDFHVLAEREKAWHLIEVPTATSDNVLLKDIIQNWLTGDGPYQAIDSPTEINERC